MTHDVIVIGAGVSGLALARALEAGGRRVLVLERARGVGGRCATRRVDGQGVDHGVAFLHGRAPEFLAEAHAACAAGACEGWPNVRTGEGTPCRPAAFEPDSVRVAPVAGMSAFAKHLARGLDVRLESNVAALRPCGEGGAEGATSHWQVTLDSGEALHARAVALTMPAPAASALLGAMSPLPEAVGALRPLLDLVHTLPSLAVIARYPAGTAAPAWEASLSGSGGGLHLMLHDSSKRARGARLVLVLQAKPGYAREHLGTPPDVWARALLAEAAALHGAWIASPESLQTHVWRKARVAEGTELAEPVAVTLEGGAMLGVCGDGLHAAGGVEGAWHSGRALAGRFLQVHSEHR